jgi:hypothetical protein
MAPRMLVVTRRRNAGTPKSESHSNVVKEVALTLDEHVCKKADASTSDNDDGVRTKNFGIFLFVFHGTRVDWSGFFLLKLKHVRRLKKMRIGIDIEFKPHRTNHHEFVWSQLAPHDFSDIRTDKISNVGLRRNHIVYPWQL